MIPSLILVGLIVGVFPRPWFWYGLVMAAIVWVLLLAFSGLDFRSHPERAVFAFLLAALNTGVGITASRLLVNAVVFLGGRLRR